MNRKLLYLGFLVLSYLGTSAQTRQVSGTVNEKGGGTLAGVNVVVKGTANGTATDTNGKFTLEVPVSATTLVVSFIGYTTQEVIIPTSNFVEVTLEASADQLEEVVITVGRGSQRTLTDTPLPVDNLAISDLRTTGQITFDQALQYRVPSFNTVNTPVNDATSLFDPYEIRNLGPSRTLILINGKRKNLTSLVYTQTSPGRGETGADLSAIPTDAIKRVEILRDGASAQYGSDAIAGVMNIILKDDYDGTTVSVNTGSTLKYGGFSYGLNYNSGASFGKKGFVNYHISLLRQEETVRKDKIDALSDARDLTDDSPASRALVQQYLQRFPDGNNQNGTPDNTSAKFLLNGAIPVGESSEVYGNAAYVYRKTQSVANYRQPYWRADHLLLHTPDPSQPDYTVAATSYSDVADDPLTVFDESANAPIVLEIAADKAAGNYRGYIGYQPSFEGDLTDYNGTLGFRTQNMNGWKQDMSLTVGGNKMLFTVNNTVNRSLRKNSPIAFKPGGFMFNHLVGNIDLAKAGSDKVFVAFGSEFRTESWQLIAGDTASYSGQGANSFPGFQERNSIKATRFNIGAYVDLTWDITEDFLVGGTFRSEKYSDFGTANVFKLTSRYKIADKITFRGSISTGFRAPTLHQQYLSLSQASFAGGDIVITGLANNFSPEARQLGVPKLKAEKSQNLSLGFGFNPSRNLSVTADYYSINIDDRIVYSTEVESISFFINAAETKTSGVDIVANYRNLRLGSATLNLNLAGNYTINNELVGGFAGVNTPQPIIDLGASIFNQTNESLLTTSRPEYKFILGADVVTSKFAFNLNNTLFGPTQFNNGDLSRDLRLEFIPKIVTDLGVTYNMSANASISLTIQNILNIFPEYKLKAMNSDGEILLADPASVAEQVSFITFNGRYPVLTYDGSHFSQMGTMFQAQFNYKF